MDELEALASVRGVDEEDLARALVLVEGGVGAVDHGGGGVTARLWEGLEVLEEPGLGRAGEAREAGRAVLGGGGAAVVHDALLEREGGADEDELGAAVRRMVGPAPGDEGLVVAGDVEDVGVELGLLDDLLVGEDAEPVAVAQAVGRPLGLAVSAGRGGVLKGGAGGWNNKCVMVLITSPMLKLAYEQSQSRFRSVFADEDGKGFSLPFTNEWGQYIVQVRQLNGTHSLHAKIPHAFLKDAPGFWGNEWGTRANFVYGAGQTAICARLYVYNTYYKAKFDNTEHGVAMLARLLNAFDALGSNIIDLLD